jgi:hypothetical protein
MTFLPVVMRYSSHTLCHSAPICCYKQWRKTARSKEIKPQGDTRFYVENPLNARGKNRGRQPVRTSTVIGVRLQTAAAYKK